MAVHLRSWAGYAGGAAAGLLFLYLLPHMGPLLVGLLLAILVDRPVTALEARGVGRGLAAALVLGGGALALVLVGVGLGTALYAEVRQLASLLHLAPHAVPSTTGGGVLAEVGWSESLPPLVQDLARRAVEAAYGAVGRWVEGVVQLVAGLPALVWPLTVSLLVAYFASRDRRMLVGGDAPLPAGAVAAPGRPVAGPLPWPGGRLSPRPGGGGGPLGAPFRHRGRPFWGLLSP